MRQTIIEGLSNKQDYNPWQDFTKKNKNWENHKAMTLQHNYA